MSLPKFVLNYLLPEPGAFWIWSREADAILWPDDTTLALFQEMEHLILSTGECGLPRFEELLIVHAATKRTWRDTFGARWQEDYPDFAQQLERIHLLANRYGHGQETSIAIRELLFDPKAYHLDSEDAGIVMKHFQQGDVLVHLREEMARRYDEPLEVKQTQGFAETMRSIMEACRDLPLETLQLDTLSKTGLPAELTPARVELPQVERIRQLAGDLLEDDRKELAGLARIARSLSAVVQLPRPLNQPQELPLGGYSDIANRGSFDRLLMTELAQDPDVLAVRVALNEALYLRRESPPRQPSRKRAILTDVGIRLWGLPRVFAHGLALAFAMQSDSDATVELFTAEKRTLNPATLDTRNGLLDLLSRLTPDPTPVPALTAFLERIEQADAATERIVITHRNVLKDPDFQEWLLRSQTGDFFLATVDSDGHYELQLFGEAGSRLLQKARLDLNALLQGTDDSVREGMLRDQDAALPAIFRQKPFPLLLVPAIPSENMLFHPEIGLVGNTNDGICYYWPQKDQGAFIVSTEFPSGIVSWRELDVEAKVARFLIPKSDGTALLFRADLQNLTGSTTRLEHGLDVVIHACRVEDHLILIAEYSMAVHRLADGERLSLNHTVQNRNCSDRFLRQDDLWYALSVSVDGVQFEPLPELPRIEDAVLVWECPGRPAPFVLFSDLSVWCLTHPAEQILASPGAQFSSLIGISTDRQRVGVHAREIRQHKIRNYFIDIATPKISIDPSSTHNELEPGGLHIQKQDVTHRRYYRGIAISKLGRLYMLSQKHSTFVLECETKVFSHLRFTKVDRPHLDMTEDWLEFERIEPPHGTRFALLQAKWTDGSVAILDHRGMLHLKSSNAQIPEVTLILKDGVLSGWISTGEFFGVKMFIQDRQAISGEQVYESVMQFTRHIIGQG